MNYRRFMIVAATGLVAGFTVFAADYDERLEYLESTGTQWSDTGLKLDYRYSVAQLNFRVLEQPTEKTAFCGVCETAGGFATAGRSFVYRLDPSGSGYFIRGSLTGSEQPPYSEPNTGTPTTDYKKMWELENYWALSGSSQAAAGLYGTNVLFYANGASRGGYYGKGVNYSKIASHTYYLGAANDGGEGLVSASGTLPKLHWYGARFYTNGKLIADFIPVKKSGVAGFYDLIGGTFHPSKGTAAWVAPTTVTWSGAGSDATDPTLGANWTGGVAPSTVHQVAVIPNGKTLSGAGKTLVDFFANLGGVRLNGTSATLLMDGLADTASWSGSVGGTGRFIAQNASSNTKVLNMYGTFANFYGTIAYSNIYTVIRNNGSFGYSGRSKAYVYLSGGSQRIEENAWNSGRGEVYLRRTGAFLFLNSNGAFNDENNYITDENSVSSDGNDVAIWYMKGKWTGNQKSQNSFTMTRSPRIYLCGEDKYLYLTQWIPQPTTASTLFGSQSKTNYIQCAVHTSPRAKNVTNAGQEQANIRIQGGYTLVFGYQNALDRTCLLQFGSSAVANKTANTIDLGGYDQRLGTLSVWSNAAFDPNAVWNENMVIRSAKPASLTLHGRLRTHNESATSAGVFPGRILGATSIIIDSQSDVMQYAYGVSDPTLAGQIRFNCPGSDTTGSLIAKRGTIEIMPTATFSNVTEIVACDEGKIIINSPYVATSVTNLLFSITNAVSAKVEIGEGVTINADVAYIDGRWFSPGSYSSTSTNGIYACTRLLGKGILKVNRYGGSNFGFAVIYR